MDAVHSIFEWTFHIFVIQDNVDCILRQLGLGDRPFHLTENQIMYKITI